MSYILTILCPPMMSHPPVQALKTITWDEHRTSQQSFIPETKDLNNENVILGTFHVR
jgi:hypothetical protein